MTKYLGSLIRFELTRNSILDKIEVRYSIICISSSFYQVKVVIDSAQVKVAKNQHYLL